MHITKLPDKMATDKLPHRQQRLLGQPQQPQQNSVIPAITKDH